MKDIIKLYKEVDFSKKEDVEKFINTLNEMKQEYSSMFGTWFGNASKLLFGEDFDFETLCDELIEKAKKQYEALSTKTKDAIDSIKTPKTPVRPSSQVNQKVLDRVTSLAVEYVDKVVSPNTELTDEQRKSVYECLVEYSCWMYNHE